MAAEFLVARPAMAGPPNRNPSVIALEVLRENLVSQWKCAKFCLLLFACLGAVAAWPWTLSSQTRATGATVFEGARLITGDGSAPIENSAFLVENNQFTRVGRKGALKIPPGAARREMK